MNPNIWGTCMEIRWGSYVTPTYGLIYLVGKKQQRHMESYFLQ